MSIFLLQISYMASLSNITETSVCSNNECVLSIELYGSTTAVDIYGEGYIVNPNLDFFP